MPKLFKRYIPIWFITFALCLAILQLLPIEKDDLFHIVYYFVIAAFTIQLLILFFALRNKDNVVSQTTFIYSIVGVVMLLVLGLHYVFLIALYSTLKNNVERDVHLKEKTETMLSLTNDVYTLYNNTNNKDIYRLYEALKHSNKSENENTKRLDNEIYKGVKKLALIKSEKDMNKLTNELIKLINERNNL